jgi:predicted nucleic acid-binding protein
LHGFTLVTSNVRDFSQIPHLTIEDWASASP